MTNSLIHDSVSAQFQSSAAEVETIFKSFRSLYDIYSSSFNDLEKLYNTNRSFKGQLQNKKTVFENAAETVTKKQEEISNQLYGQALVLLVGNAESLTREMFRILLRNNIRMLKTNKKLEIPLTDVLSADTDEKLGDIVLNILEKDKNPTEKLNFQNMKQLQGILGEYFKIMVRNDLIQELHEFWQIRHIIIHKSGLIDQQFVDNLNAASINSKEYVIGKKIKISKTDYEKCFYLLILLFENFDQEIEKLTLRYNTE